MTPADEPRSVNGESSPKRRPRRRQAGTRARRRRGRREGPQWSVEGVEPTGSGQGGGGGTRTGSCLSTSMTVTSSVNGTPSRSSLMSARTAWLGIQKGPGRAGVDDGSASSEPCSERAAQHGATTAPAGRRGRRTFCHLGAERERRRLRGEGGCDRAAAGDAEGVSQASWGTGGEVQQAEG